MPYIVRNVPHRYCVYLIYADDTLLYVGQTSRTMSRLRNHMQLQP